MISVLLGLGTAAFFIITENPYVLTSGFWRQIVPAKVIEAGALSGTIEGYRTVGIATGLWQGGAAAPWDFTVLDHFKWFRQPYRARGYKPAQPIQFSHVTHVQQNRMECQYCHWTVTKSPFAAIPEVQSCAGCHNRNMGVNLGRTDAQKAEIAKIAEYMSGNAPVPWVKVHVMPDHVRFNHKRHVKAGLGCQECHGQIPEMSAVERVSSMKMGWCIGCHREKGASVDCWTCHK